MPVVKIKQIKVTLKKSIEYITRANKTRDGALVKYSDGEFEGAKKVTEDMMYDLMNGVHSYKEGDVLAHHIIQSFKPGEEITAEEVHALGVQFIKEFTNCEHRYILATHVDKEHIHNHIIVCAMNQKTGHKMRVQRDTLQKLRDLSDKLCRIAGVHVITNAQPNHAFSMADIYLQGDSTNIKQRVRGLVTAAALEADSFSSLRDELLQRGVRMNVRGAHITYTLIDSGFKIRDSKLGVSYDPVGLATRIGRSSVYPISFNKRMILSDNGETLTVKLPQTHGKKCIRIAKNQTLSDGTTYRAFLSEDQPVMIFTRENRYAAHMNLDELREFFAPDYAKITRHESSSERFINATPGVSDAQKRYYSAVRRRSENLSKTVEAYETISSYGSVEKTLDALKEEIDSKKDALYASIVALKETHEQRGNANEVKELIGQIDALESEISESENMYMRVHDLAEKNSKTDKNQDKQTRNRAQNR
ncbi:hypothetical protein B9G54_04490 [Alloscardovia macacae]|uniref:MobA/VirD2-like nuclease domain-containing protein n=1 Tax=Alloscardovia macacae TaxID=1160091 RepID=A0A1Y2STV8_9BIFI|nr:relaxase/mobilization nuclease domain-containing protein [Alloscardovia macacae]OTA26453.1 hypothetical protein B9G54_04490 [Alloscardovia macacae]OTA29867.1 hypothetical protein B9T39_01955 [Alloscardovia macacae]